MLEVTLPPRALRFGVFEVDLRAGELRKEGGRVGLQGRPLQILAHLLEHHQKAVTPPLAMRERRRSFASGLTTVDFLCI